MTVKNESDESLSSLNRRQSTLFSVDLVSKEDESKNGSSVWSKFLSSDEIQGILTEIFNKKWVISECFNFKKLENKTLRFSYTLGGNESFGLR